jgi:anaphase-promoting complex subunit 10
MQVRCAGQAASCGRGNVRRTGCGVAALLDTAADTYWQSDGAQPHIVDVQFARKTNISYVALYLDYKQDESYTPNKLVLRMGMHVRRVGVHT